MATRKIGIEGTSWAEGPAELCPQCGHNWELAYSSGVERIQQKQYLHFMVLFQLPFVDQDKTYTAEVSLEGIRDSWDARITIVDYPGGKELRAKFWLGDFLMPVFASRKEAQLFEPLLEAIDVQAKVRLPEEFRGGRGFTVML